MVGSNCRLEIVLYAPGGGLGASLIRIAAVPLIDAVFVVLRRLRQGRRPWIGGTDHLGHTLLRKGVSAKTLPVLYAATALAIGLMFTALHNS